MRTITETFNVYTFGELSDEAKEKAISDYAKDPMTIQLEIDSFEEYAKIVLTEIGFSGVDIQFSLSNCQGDGFSFTFDTLTVKDIKTISNNSNVDIKVDEKLFEENDFEITSFRNQHRYSHKYTVTVEAEFYDGEKVTEEERENMLDIEEAIRNIYYQHCDNLESDGYSFFNRYQDESFKDEFLDISDTNGWEYLEDGTLF